MKTSREWRLIVEAWVIGGLYALSFVPLVMGVLR